MMIDIHSHILYGVDDGCKTMDDAINMIKECIKSGITDLFFTPHYSYRRKYTVSYEEIEMKFDALKQEVSKNNLNINLYLGSEIDETSQIYNFLKNSTCHTMNQTKYVLVDFGTRIADIDDICYELIVRGYIPIIAHPERYTYIDDIDLMKKWKKTGALLQVNASSLFSNGIIKKQASLLLKNKLVDFIASDTHQNNKTIDFLSKAAHYIEQKFGKEEAIRLFVTNPQKMLKS